MTSVPAHCPLPSLPISQIQERWGAPLVQEAQKPFFAANAALHNHCKIHSFDQVDIYKYRTILSPPKQHVSDTK